MSKRNENLAERDFDRLRTLIRAEAGINLQLISTSEIKISVVIEQPRADEAARVAHAAFKLETL